MKKTTKKYVEYLYPGLIVSETSSKEIEHADPTKVEVPDYSVGFRFYEQEFVIDGSEQFVGKIKNRSNWYFIGKKLTIDEVKKQFEGVSQYDILIRNLEINNVYSVCMTDYGNFMPMEEQDITLEEYISQNNKKIIQKKK